MASVSGLSDKHRAQARKTILTGVELLMANPAAIHYTQGKNRWQGIDQHMDPHKGKRPTYSDCSSSSTWLLWAAMCLPYGVRDVVNGTAWTSGYTGTMLQHGKVVQHIENVKVGDCFLYGQRGSTGAHVAISIGGTKAFSHGGERGPFIVDYRYRPDLMCIRRYI